MVGRSKQKPAASPSLTIHQIVAYNFRRAREEAGWTQTLTSDRLEPYLGYRLNQAGVSAIEKTFDSERRRNIDVAEVVGFARCFGLPVSWFFVPPADMGDHLLEPVLPGQGPREQEAITLVSQVLGTPPGWRAVVERLRELIETDRRRAIEAIEAALSGRIESFEEQINLRRSTMMQVTLARRAGPHDEAVTKMAAALLELVRMTPEGFMKLQDQDPDEALRILAEGDELVAPFTARAEAKRQAGEPSRGGYDDLETIDLRAALGLESEG